MFGGSAEVAKTNFPPYRIAEVLQLARKTDEAAIKKYVLGPPYSNHPTNLSTYILIPDMERIAKLSVDLFGAESRYAVSD